MDRHIDGPISEGQPNIQAGQRLKDKAAHEKGGIACESLEECFLQERSQAISRLFRMRLQSPLHQDVSMQ